MNDVSNRPHMTPHEILRDKIMRTYDFDELEYICGLLSYFRKNLDREFSKKKFEDVDKEEFSVAYTFLQCDVHIYEPLADKVTKAFESLVKL